MKIKSFPRLQRLTVASEISEARRKTNYAKLALFSSCTKEEGMQESWHYTPTSGTMMKREGRPSFLTDCRK